MNLRFHAVSDIIFISFAIILTYISISLFLLEKQMHLIYIFVSLVNVSLAVRFRRDIPVLIILVFGLLYVIEMRHFFSFGLRISYWNSFQDAYHISKALVLYNLFLLPFLFLALKVKERNMFPVSAIRSSNVVVFYSSILFFLALSHVGISGDTVISSGYGSNDSNKSALFEYAIIFFVISQIYTSSSFVQKTVTLICLIYFCLKSVLYGGRIEALQAGLAFLYMAYDFGRDIDKKKLISMGLLALVLMTFVGVIRSNPELISRALRGDFSMEMLFSVPKTGIVSSQFGDVMQASSRMVGLADSGFWTSELRIMSFLSFIFNIFLYGSSFQETSNLALLDQTSFGAGGGGLISAYFYVWLGWLGPFFAGIWLVVSLYLGLYRNKVNMFLAIYAISLIITFPRWLAYSPVVFVKYGVFAILCMLAFYIYNRVIREFLST